MTKVWLSNFRFAIAYQRQKCRWKHSEIVWQSLGEGSTQVTSISDGYFFNFDFFGFLTLRSLQKLGFIGEEASDATLYVDLTLPLTAPSTILNLFCSFKAKFYILFTEKNIKNLIFFSKLFLRQIYRFFKNMLEVD